MRDITYGGGWRERKIERERRRERGINIFVLKMFRDLYNLTKLRCQFEFYIHIVCQRVIEESKKCNEIAVNIL